MGLFDNENDDASSTIGRLGIEQRGGSVRDLPMGGYVVERPNYGGSSTFDRHDAIGNQTDTHQGFNSPW